MQRRQILKLGIGAAIAAGGARLARARASPRTLRVAPARQSLVGEAYAPTEVWAYEGQDEPLLSFARGSSQIIEFANDTAWHHPIHLHGHVFRVLSRDGKSEPGQPWADTVLLDPDSRAEVAFVGELDIVDARLEPFVCFRILLFEQQRAAQRCFDGSALALGIGLVENRAGKVETYLGSAEDRRISLEGKRVFRLAAALTTW